MSYFKTLKHIRGIKISCCVIITENNYYSLPLISTKAEAFYYVPQKKTLGLLPNVHYGKIFPPTTTTQKD